MANVQNLTETSLTRFSIFIKFLAENDLIDAAVQHLKENGYETILISVEPIREVQRMLQEKLDKGENGLGARSEDTNNIIMSGHNNDSC